RAEVELDTAEVELGQRDAQGAEVGDVGDGDHQPRVAGDRNTRVDVELGLQTADGWLEQDAVGDLRELDEAVVVDVAGGVGQREGQLDLVVDGGVAGVGVEDEDALGQPGGDAAEGDFRFQVLPSDQG